MCILVSSEPDCRCTKHTDSRWLAVGYFVMKFRMFPFSIHQDTIQGSDNFGAMPMGKMFGCLACLETITALQYCLYQKATGQILDLATSKETSYLVNLIDRVLLIHAGGFDGEGHFCNPWISEPPDTSESPRCKHLLARLAEWVRNCV